MNRKSHVIVLLIMMILTSMLALTGCIHSEAGYDTNTNQTNWLLYIQDDAPITKIAIPGTHDSGTFGMMSSAATQGATIGRHLVMGARYFDIRVDGKGQIFHGPIAHARFDDIAKSLYSFITANPSEFLILDFQHFKKGGDEYVIKTLEEIGLSDLAVKKNDNMTDREYINSLTLKDVRGKVLVFFGDSVTSDRDYVFSRNDDGCTRTDTALDSLYISELNKLRSEEYINEAMPKYSKHITSNNNGIMVLQGQLTSPNMGNLKKLESGHDSNMTEYINNIASKEILLQEVNVIMRDFYEANPEKCLSILRLNYYKNIVKDEYRDRYSEFTHIKQL